MKSPSPFVRPNPWLDRYFSEYYTEERFDREKSIVILIGSLSLSGGTHVIMRHASRLADEGWRVTLCPLLLAKPKYDRLPAGIELLPIGAVKDVEFDVALATWWPTVGHLEQIRARHYVYFVQSIESRFDDGGVGIVGEATYSVDIPVVTIASWLQAYLSFEHRRPSFLAVNGLEREIFRPVGESFAARNTEDMRVLIEGSPGVLMKGVREAVEACVGAGVEDIWLLSPTSTDAPEGVDRVFSECSRTDVAKVMRSCDVLLKASHVEGMFGPPLEMLATGGAVVSYRVTGAEEFLTDGHNALLVPMGDHQALEDAVRRLKEDRDVLRSLQAAAAESVEAWPDWRSASSRFVHIMNLIAAQPRCDRSLLRPQFALLRQAGPDFAEIW